VPRDDVLDRGGQRRLVGLAMQVVRREDKVRGAAGVELFAHPEPPLRAREHAGTGAGPRRRRGRPVGPLGQQRVDPPRRPLAEHVADADLSPARAAQAHRQPRCGERAHPGVNEVVVQSNRLLQQHRRDPYGRRLVSDRCDARHRLVHV
jgi:hypothetical protein